ncbi:tetratricopeptide repeat protein [Paucidesulfovibrio longus]|uniref:tetratricopeptide repeat protein n=1 Tax=Paucidesulfovibrio longus TaxID=889 RepID=UPI0003B2FD95|nr:tetratricopeptide repeat protein [Paucidesulfovibrio longus]
MNKTSKISAALLLTIMTLTACSTRTQASMAMADDPAQAVALYRQSLSEHPDSARTRIMLGKALIHNGEYAEAETQLTEALQKLPDDPEAAFYLDLTEIGKSGPGGALARLMNYRPYDNEKIGEAVRLEAQRASVRNLDAAEVIRRMEAAYERGRLDQRNEKSLLIKVDEN